MLMGAGGCSSYFFITIVKNQPEVTSRRKGLLGSQFEGIQSVMEGKPAGGSVVAGL